MPAAEDNKLNAAHMSDDDDSQEPEVDLLALVQQMLERSISHHAKEREKQKAGFLKKINELKAKTDNAFDDSEKANATRDKLVRLQELLQKRDQLDQALQKNTANLTDIINKAQRSLGAALSFRLGALERLNNGLASDTAGF